MTADELRQHAINLIVSHARDVEFLSIAEYLADEEIDDPDDAVARAIDDLIVGAVVSVTW